MKRLLSALVSAALLLNIGAGIMNAVPLNTETAIAASNDFQDASLSEYHISTAQDLVDFNKSDLDFQGKTVYLDADIDMDGISWSPRDFFGCFDGQYHTVSNLKQGSGGLFRYNYGIVYRLNLEQYEFSAVSSYHAVLLREGESPRKGYIGYVTGLSEGSIYFYNEPAYVGGICSYNYGKIYGCTANGECKIRVEKDGNFDAFYYYNVNPDYQGEFSGSICAVNVGEIAYCTGNESISGAGSGSIKNCAPDYPWTRDEVNGIELTDEIAAAGALVVSPESLDLYEGTSRQISATVNGRSVSASYRAADPDIVEITGSSDSADRYVEAKAAGDTTIEISFGKQKKTVAVHVSALGELTVSPEYISLREGDTQEISITVNGKPVTNDLPYSITSENSKIAAVSSTTVTAKSYGYTKIQVKLGDQVKYIDVEVFGNIKAIPANDFSDMDADEFRITTPEGMLAFAEACRFSWDKFLYKTVYLDADIDMTDQGYIAPPCFPGTFDGRNHTITGLSARIGAGGDQWTNSDGQQYDLPCDRGLLVDQNDGVIYRLTLDDISITAIRSVGIFEKIEYIDEYQYTIEYIPTSIIAPRVGGICAANCGIISDCYVWGKVELENACSPYVEQYACAYDVFGNEIKDSGYYAETWPDDYYIDDYKYSLEDQSTPAGDVTDDSVFNTADAVALQKWLLTAPKAGLNNWRAGDLNGDSKLSAADLSLMKRALLQNN